MSEFDEILHFAVRGKVIVGLIFYIQKISKY